ncbi:MAG: tetratricopeptide repeat protein [Gammaproteobacteria bacterium]|nr:tetratricopeptide repeat protein [Gammaproteobacteria bacterium]
MSTNEFVHVVTETSFEQDVIQRSQHVPVVVDYWADWCNPCKILMPILAKLAGEYKGAFHLAKINTEQQRNLSAQHGIRSLPTVRIYRHGEVVDEFNGAIPESRVREIIEKHIHRPEDELLQQALPLLASQQTAQAVPLLQQALQLNPHSIKTLTSLADAYLALNMSDELATMIQNLPVNLAEDSSLQVYVSRMRFVQRLQNAPDQASLEQRIAANDSDVEAHYLLAAYRATQQQWEAAMDGFLKVISLDRKFGDDAGRKAVLEIFNILGGSGPVVTMYRVKMARLLH